MTEKSDASSTTTQITINTQKPNSSILLEGNLVTWRSKKESVVAKSSVEVEF